MNILQDLQRRFHDALTGLVADPAPYAAMVKPAQDARFGDYQANCAMSLGKVLGKPPRVVAQTLVERLRLDDLLEPPEIAGPGFINLRLRTDWLARQVETIAGDDRLGVAPASPPKTFVIDYSSPNVAKPMHVGHLRSTIIGDSLARLLRFLGHHVVTDNHLGDWGTQFGILLYGYKHLRDEAAFQADPVRELARLYVEVREPVQRRGDDEDERRPGRPGPGSVPAGDGEAARRRPGERPALADVHAVVPGRDRPIYRRLDVHFDHTLGESFYNPMLPGVVQDLLAKGIAQESEGAVIIPRGENAAPSLIRKRDGAFTYTTTDLATIQYRLKQWHPDAILYVVDFRQGALHEPVRRGAALGRFGGAGARLVRLGAGQGRQAAQDARRRRAGAERPARRSRAAGGPVYEAARQEAADRGEEIAELSAETLQTIYEVVGLGAVKYADLSQNRDQRLHLRSG